MTGYYRRIQIAFVLAFVVMGTNVALLLTSGLLTNPLLR
jgi:hypothetical protein